VKYQNPENFVNAKQENVLRQWDKSDTTDARERLRNDRVSTFQKIRNPFIDHPEFIDRIKSTYSVSPTIPAPDISASPFNVVFDTLKANDTSSYYIAVMNYGTGNLNLNSVSSSIPQFVVESYPTIVPQSELRYIKVRFHPTAINQTYNGILTIQNSDSTITVNLKGFSNSQVGITQISAEVPQKFSLYQNYPNPFNPLTKIKFDIAQSSPSIPLQRGTLVGQAFLPVILEVFDITGREVITLVNESLQPGTYEVRFNAENLTGGIYFYRLTSGDFSSVKKAILLK